jgi:succinate dehydrogenase/fumarate reductase flavoprotein subunit
MNDGDSTYRLFYDTIKGGDYRAREANVYRLAEVSANIIDQCVAQGVPFARDYGGLLDNRSFGGTQVSELSTQKVRQVSSSCWVLIPHFLVRWVRAMWKCSTAMKCWMW